MPSAATARETSTQCIPGPATSSDGRTKSPSTSSLRAILNSGSATPERPGAGQHHVHRQPAAALGDEVLLGGRHHLGGGPAGRVRLRPDLEAAAVDAHRVAHALELGVALDRAREVELDVERDDVEALERAVVAHRHHVVEAVDADPAPAGVARVGGDRRAGMRVEALLDQRRPVLADVAGLGGEDDERLAVRRHDDVRVPVDDLEAGQVRDRPLEARVLAPRDDQRRRARAPPSRRGRWRSVGRSSAAPRSAAAAMRLPPP